MSRETTNRTVASIDRYKSECTPHPSLSPRRDPRSRWKARGEGYRERGDAPCQCADTFATLNTSGPRLNPVSGGRMVPEWST
jgi:hypothetical protein